MKNPMIMILNKKVISNSSMIKMSYLMIKMLNSSKNSMMLTFSLKKMEIKKFLMLNSANKMKLMMFMVMN